MRSPKAVELPDGGNAVLMGYADKMSVTPGESISVKVSSEPGPYLLELVRLKGPVHPDEPSAAVTREPIAHPANGRYVGRRQPLRPGSFGRVDIHPAVSVESFIVDTWFLPTLRSPIPQMLLSASGGSDGDALVLKLVGNQLSFEMSQPSTYVEATVECTLPAASRQWLRAVAGYDPRSGALWLSIRGSGRWDADRVHVDAFASTVSRTGNVRLRRIGMAAELASTGPRHFFNGRLERPRILDSPLASSASECDTLIHSLDRTDPVAEWDFSLDIAGDRALDTGPLALHANLHNQPTRAVTGHAWKGESLNFNDDPLQWAAIHFHGDDLADAGWKTDFTIEVPPDMPSGIYAAHLAQGDHSDDVPFYVTGTEHRHSDVLFLAPTNTYLAYGNEHLAHGARGPAHESMMAAPIKLTDVDRYLRDHPELGLSLYDTHRDGSGVTFASRLRPLLNMRPDYITWLTAGRRHFAADFYITGWLDHQDVEYDVATDEDLDRLGVALLDRYRVVVTGSHPEYVTRREYDAFEQYAAGGGKIMYLGANGFFWVTSYTTNAREIIECRRGVAAQRNWTSHPAEVRHSSTGELGGAWLHRGRNSRELFGVGMCAAGWGPASPYSRTPASRDPDVEAIFADIVDGPVGAAGCVLGGAAGDELDSADYSRGTPLHAKILLSSRHGNQYLPTLEAVESIAPDNAGAANPAVRADVVLLSTANGGEVFSTGSICWAGSLASQDYESSVAKITTAVLRRFLG